MRLISDKPKLAEKTERKRGDETHDYSDPAFVQREPASQAIRTVSSASHESVCCLVSMSRVCGSNLEEKKNEEEDGEDGGGEDKRDEGCTHGCRMYTAGRDFRIEKSSCQRRECRQDRRETVAVS
jgi:hypothetical protein